MAVNENGEVIGGVSGGCVEGAVVEIADRVIGGEGPQLVHFGIADSEAWDVGLPCGGEIDVWVQSYRAGPVRRDLAGGRARRRGDAARGRGPRRQAAARGRRRALGDAGRARARRRGAERRRRVDLDRRRRERRGSLFVDIVAPAPRLIVFGAVDIAASLCRLARDAGWRPYVVDPRARFATRERFPDAEEVIAAWPQEAFERLGGIDPATSIAVLTHDPKLDDAALQIALRSPARFIGAMGSRGRRPSGASGCSPPDLPTRNWSGCRRRSGSTWARSAREETALSILPRWSPRATGARAAGWPTQGPDPRGRRLDRRPDPGGRRGVERFGIEPKLLADLNGRPLLEYALRAQCAVAELERVVVVLGSRADEVLAAVDFGRAEPVVCPTGTVGSRRRQARVAPARSSHCARRGDQGDRDARRRAAGHAAR